MESLNIQNIREAQILYKISEKYGRLNVRTQNYVDEEFSTVLARKRVIGVLYRGTDYVKFRPPGHPIQPTLQQLAEVCKARIAEQRYRYIYITTDEKRAVDYFTYKFPECEILVNKRTYFDEFYKEPTTKDIASCRHEREKDKYFTALEYISSVRLLARRDELVSGNCGGSREAMILNGGKYKYVKIFDLGSYRTLLH